MVITFFGQSQIEDKESVEEEVFATIKSLVKDEQVDFFFGLTGDFDDIAKKACRRFQQINNNAKIVFITPSLDELYLRLIKKSQDIDEIVFADVEFVPKDMAVTERNRWMIGQADFIITYVDYDLYKDLSYKMMTFTFDMNKPCINLSPNIWSL